MTTTFQKLAQNRGGGGGKVIVRQVVGPDGVKRLTVLRHEGGATCGSSRDEEILKRLNQMHIPGYGGGGEEMDSGKTNEAFENKQKSNVPFHIQPPNLQKPEEEEEEEQTSRRRIDQGFGV